MNAEEFNREKMNIPAMENLLNSPEFFKCEKIHVRMAKSLCAHYRSVNAYDCANCEQGKEIAENVIASAAKQSRIRDCHGAKVPRNDTRGATGPSTGSESPEKEKNMEKREKKLCCCPNNCGRPAEIRGLNKKCYDKWTHGQLPGMEPFVSTRPSPLKGMKRGSTKKQRAEFAPVVKKHEESYPDESEPVVRVNFNGYARVLRAVAQCAASQVRTVEQQIIWELQQSMALGLMMEQKNETA